MTFLSQEIQQKMFVRMHRSGTRTTSHALILIFSLYVIRSRKPAVLQNHHVNHYYNIFSRVHQVSKFTCFICLDCLRSWAPICHHVFKSIITQNSLTQFLFYVFPPQTEIQNATFKLHTVWIITECCYLLKVMDEREVSIYIYIYIYVYYS